MQVFFSEARTALGETILLEAIADIVAREIEFKEFICLSIVVIGGDSACSHISDCYIADAV